jgi:outer membrane immunogenic protein
MKKFALSFTALALTAAGAFAADLPSRKGPPVLPPPPPPPPIWTGFYAGLNAGYGFGTNGNVQSAVWGQDATVYNGFGKSAPWGNPVGPAGNLHYHPNVNLLNEINNSFPTGAGLSQSGSFSNTQNGFIGGGQIGYNFQWGPNFVIGLEADIQGTGIRGGAHGGAGAVNSSSFDGYNCRFFNNGNRATCSQGAWSNAANSIGGTTVNAGVDWLGTVRGRIGYLWYPTMLVYATGGLTYGGVYANVRHAGITQLDNSFTTAAGFRNENVIAPSLNYTFIGGGNKSQTLVGWNVGGGLEWMFMPNWSLKAEAIYWNMGNMNVPTVSFATAPVSNALDSAGLSTFGATRVNYQGVIARAGVNYHFNWFGPAAAKY